MQSFPLIRNQLLPPRISALLRRERLIETGLQILSHRVTSVIAPAGYGKSVWVASLTEEEGWPSTAWLSLDDNDRESTCFLYHLIHAVQMVWPEFGAQSLRTLNSLANIHTDWPVAAAAFLEELPDQELVLVLDDFHLVQDNSNNPGIIEYLIRWLPANLHLIIISRLQLPLNLSRYRMQSELWEVSGGQLLFTAGESRNFLAMLNLDLSEEDLSRLQQATEGWAVCLRLAATLLKQSGKQTDKTLQTIAGRDSALYQYLGNELLALLPKNLKDFILFSSLLPYLEEKLCNSALKCRNSQAKIETLHAAGLLSRVEGDIVTWRLHHLIKDYLIQEAEKGSPHNISGIRSRACSFLEKRGEIDQAIEQAVALEDWPMTAKLICRHGHEYFAQTSRLDALFTWVERLPETLVDNTPWLLFFKARSILQIDNGLAMKLLSDAADKAYQTGDMRCEALCLLAMSYTQLETFDIKQGRLIMKRLQSNPLLGKDPGSYGAVLLVKLSNAILLDDIRSGLEYSRLALQLKLNPEQGMMVLFGSAVIQHRAGNLLKARTLLEQALDMTYVQENERWQVTAFFAFSTILNLIGDSAGVEDICRKGLHLTRKYRMAADEARFHRNLARMYMRERRFSEALVQCKEASACFSDSGSRQHYVYNRIEMALVHMHAGENARDLLEEMQELLRQIEDEPIGQGGDQVAASVVGIIAIEAGELDYARNVFESLLYSHRENGARQSLSGTSLILSYVYLLQGNELASDNELRKALSLAEAGQWVNFWEWYERAILVMCRRAIQKNIHAGWALQIINKWFPECARPVIGLLLVSPDKNLQAFARTQLQSFFQETGKTVVNLFYFNRFRIFVNGREVPESNWKTQKAESLLKLLAADRRHHSREIIVEQLWPDSKSGDANLRMAVSQVRKVLGNYGASNECILMQKKTVCLNPDVECNTDIDFFYSEVQEALKNRSHPREITHLEQAANIYCGPFLPQDVYDAWTNNDRLRLQGLYLHVLKRLAELYSDRNNHTGAGTAYSRYLEMEPADEVITRSYMQHLNSAGQRQKALSVYHGLEKTLQREYNICPENETRDLYERICRHID